MLIAVVDIMEDPEVGTDRWFRPLVIFYKIILLLSTLCFAVLFGLVCIATRDDFPILIALVIASDMALEAVGWVAVLTLSPKYLYINMWSHAFALAVVLIYQLYSLATGIQPVFTVQAMILVCYHVSHFYTVRAIINRIS